MNVTNVQPESLRVKWKAPRYQVGETGGVQGWGGWGAGWGSVQIASLRAKLTNEQMTKEAHGIRTNKVVDGILIVEFNKAKRKNSITYEMYCELGRIFTSASVDKEVIVIVLTSEGTCGYFSAGN